MGAIPLLQHMHTLPHLARELLGSWLLLFLSKMLNVGIFFYQREKRQEMLISGQPFAPGKDMDTGKWHPASCD